MIPLSDRSAYQLGVLELVIPRYMLEQATFLQRQAECNRIVPIGGETTLQKPVDSLASLRATKERKESVDERYSTEESDMTTLKKSLLRTRSSDRSTDAPRSTAESSETATCASSRQRHPRRASVWRAPPVPWWTATNRATASRRCGFRPWRWSASFAFPCPCPLSAGDDKEKVRGAASVAKRNKKIIVIIIIIPYCQG